MNSYFLVIVIVFFIIMYLVVCCKSTYPRTMENFNDLPLPQLVIAQDPDGMETQSLNEIPTYPEKIITDPETLVKLKRTILTNSPRSSKTMVAYNDLSAYRPGGIRPFNSSDSIISQTQATDPVYNADIYYNPYYALWDADQKATRDQVADRTEQILKSGATCVDFKNINQCMSVCSNSPNCKSFYINSLADPETKTGKNTCCMLTYPPYAANRHSYDGLPDNIDQFSYRTIGELIKRDKLIDGKLVFDHVRDDGGNRTYKVDLDRKMCRSLCPKCIMGRCPENYRCTNMAADPRYNQSCLITNEDTYNEKIGRTFDSPTVPYLDARYQLNEYAGYDANTYPLYTVPESERYNLTDHVLPTFNEEENFFTKYDVHKVGPPTYHPVFNKAYNVELESENPAEIAIRGHNDPINIAAHKRAGPYYKTNRTVPRVDPPTSEYKKN